jgi:cytochrome c556
MMSINRSKPALTGIAVAVAIGGASSLCLAHSGASGVVKERMDLMKDMADSMKAMGAMFKGETAFDPAMVAKQAGFLADHAPMIPDMTPEGSNDHPSEALPAIWQAWDDYVTDSEALAAESAKLVDIVNNGADQAAARDQFLKLSKTCGTCHDRFRKPKS